MPYGFAEVVLFEKTLLLEVDAMATPCAVLFETLLLSKVSSVVVCKYIP